MFLDEQIVTYLGNKRKLLNLIISAAKPENKVCLDLFSGSGIVARAFKENKCKKIITNDLEEYSKIINTCYLTNIADFPKQEYEYYYNLIINAPKIEGFITKLYSPKNSNDIKAGERCFYTHENAIILDSYLSAIHTQCPEYLKPFFLAPLMSEASIHANTSGVFKGFYKNTSGIGQWGGQGKNALSRICGEITLKRPIFSSHNCEKEILQFDTTKMNNDINCDLAYLDPPYNQHPYGSNYFMLNLIVTYKEPEKISTVSGIPNNWNRSDFNKKAIACQSLKKSLDKIKAKEYIISYNNEGFITYDEMVSLLETYGEVGVITEDYPTFRGCRNLSNRALHTKEYLFCVKN